MASEKQIAANRINAQKCSGPITAAGKAASSQNALKTGLHAKSDVIATENRDEYETLIAEYHDRFQPATPEERCLADDLVRSEWLSRRYMAATTAIWEYDFGINDQQDMGATFVRRSETLSCAQRFITVNQRNFAGALKQLQKIQASRVICPAQAAAADPQASDTKSLNQKLVSFPQTADIPPESPAPTTNPQEEIPLIAA